jgi:hypothetical protein
MAPLLALAWGRPLILVVQVIIQGVVAARCPKGNPRRDVQNPSDLPGSARPLLYRSKGAHPHKQRLAAVPGRGGGVGQRHRSFHQTKSEPSYFGGVIQSLEAIESLPGDEESPGRQRYNLTLKSTAAAKGAVWDKRGLSHGMAWSSGVITE